MARVTELSGLDLGEDEALEQCTRLSHAEAGCIEVADDEDDLLWCFENPDEGTCRLALQSAGGLLPPERQAGWREWCPAQASNAALRCLVSSKDHEDVGRCEGKIYP
jgi:hypothetical protein